MSVGKISCYGESVRKSIFFYLVIKYNPYFSTRNNHCAMANKVSV